jgi:hypothetical protein
MEQCCAIGGREPDLELLAGRFVDATGGQILSGLRRCLGSRGAQVRGVEPSCAIEGNELARATLAACLDAGIRGLKLHSGALRKELERGREVEALRELNQTQRVAAGVAAEALEQLLGGRDRERRCALVVQRATPDHAACAGSSQLRVAASNLDEVCASRTRWMATSLKRANQYASMPGNIGDGSALEPARVR